MSSMVSVLLPAAILLEVIPVHEPHIGLAVEIHLNNIAWTRVKFILQEVHGKLPQCVNDNATLAIDLAPSKPLAITGGPGVAAHVIAAFFPVSRLIMLQEAHTFDPLG